jgi:hypothetical protein
VKYTDFNISRKTKNKSSTKPSENSLEVINTLVWMQIVNLQFFNFKVQNVGPNADAKRLFMAKSTLLCSPWPMPGKLV